MRSIRALLLLGFVLVLGVGCTTNSHFSKLPTPQEFAKPLQQLKQEYPDLSEYESLFVSVYGMPEAGPLREAWGKPHSTGFSAWMLWPYFWVLHPLNYWYWEFDGKKVSALIDRPILFSYQPHVLKLKVVDQKK